MGVRTKIEKFNQQKTRVKELSAQVEKNKVSKKAAQDELQKCRSQLSELRDAPKQMKWGIFLIAVGVILLVIEIMCVTETIIVGYSDLDLIDIALVGVPLVLGIIKVKKARRAQIAVSAEELQQRTEALAAEIDRYEQVEAQYEEAKNGPQYPRREWDLRTFRPTPQNIAALEQDFEDLLIAVKFNPDKDQIINSWLSVNQLMDSTAIFGQDQAQIDAFRAGTTRIKQCGSWKLEVALIAQSSLAVELLNIAMSNGAGAGLSFAEAMEKSDVRAPKTDEEKALLELAHETVPTIVFEVGYALKKMRQQ